MRRAPLQERNQKMTPKTLNATLTALLVGFREAVPSFYKDSEKVIALLRDITKTCAD